MSIVYGVASLLRLRASYGLTFDLGFYLQQVWLLDKGISHGSLANLPVFADHLSPVLYVFVPLADSRSLAAVFVLVQAVAVGTTAGILIARFGASASGWWSVAYFVLSPALGFATLFDFHPLLIGLPVVAGLLLALERRAPELVLIALMVATLLIREDVAIVAAALAIFKLWREPGRRWSKGTAALVAVAAVGYAIVASVMLVNQLHSPVHSRYDWIRELVVGGSWPGIESVWSFHALVTMIVVYFPVLLVPRLARETTTILAMGVSLFFIAGDVVAADSVYYQYQSLPVLLMAWGIGRTLATGTLANANSEGWRLRGRMVAAGSLAWAVMLGPFGVVAPPVEVWDRWMPHVLQNQERMVLAELVDIVPAEASVSATNTLGPHLAQRENIYDFPDPLSCEGMSPAIRSGQPLVDYVVVTESETDARDLAKIEEIGYTLVHRVADAHVFRFTDVGGESRQCLS